MTLKLFILMPATNPHIFKQEKKLQDDRNLVYWGLWGPSKHQNRIPKNPSRRNPFSGPFSKWPPKSVNFTHYFQNSNYSCIFGTEKHMQCIQNGVQLHQTYVYISS